jgi:hypothetical protein
MNVKNVKKAYHIHLNVPKAKSTAVLTVVTEVFEDHEGKEQLKMGYAYHDPRRDKFMRDFAYQKIGAMPFKPFDKKHQRRIAEGRANSYKGVIVPFDTKSAEAIVYAFNTGLLPRPGHWRKVKLVARGARVYGTEHECTCLNDDERVECKCGCKCGK